MGNFNCSSCGAEYHLPLRSTFICPNCNISLTDSTETLAEQQRAQAKLEGWGSLGEPIVSPTEYIIQIGAEGVTPLESEVLNVQRRAFLLWRERQAKYGPANIAATGALGCYVRCNDKLARLGMVYLQGLGGSAPDETIIDSWLDLLNYALMGLMCHEGTWPGTNKA